MNKAIGTKGNNSVFSTYFSATKVPALKSVNLFRANAGVNDRKLFQVNVFKTAAENENKPVCSVVLFLFLTLINVCFKVLSDLLIKGLT